MELLIPVIQVMIAFQCLIFIGYMCIDQRFARKANRILAAFLTVFVLHMVFNLINRNFGVSILPMLRSSLGYLYGPLLYLYVSAATLQDFHFNRLQLLHLVPFLVIAIFSLFAPLPVVVLASGIFLDLPPFGSPSFKLDFDRYCRPAVAAVA